MWDEITHQFPNFNGATVEVSEWISNFIQHFTGHVITYTCCVALSSDDVIKWEHFPRYWPFVRGIHRSPVNFTHKGQWRVALIFFFNSRLNKRLSKQSWGWWFETPSSSLWRHCNAIELTCRIDVPGSIMTSHSMIWWPRDSTAPFIRSIQRK